MPGLNLSLTPAFRVLNYAFLLSTLLIAGCGGSNDDDDHANAQTPETPVAQPNPSPTTPGNTSNPGNPAVLTNLDVFPEPGSPLLLGFTPEGGTAIALTGERNAAGDPVRADSMLVNAESENVGQLSFDENNIPSTAILPDGTKLSFFFSEVNVVDIVIETPEGIRTVTEVTSDQPMIAGEVSAVKNMNIRRALAETKGAVSKANPSPGSRQVVANVTNQRSGRPVTGAKVLAEAGSGSKFTYKLPLTEQGAGSYSGSLPGLLPSAASQADLEKSCNNALIAGKALCRPGAEFSKMMVLVGCTPVAAAASAYAGPGAPAVFGTVLAVCEGFFAQVAVGCKVIADAPSTMTGPPSQAFCAQVRQIAEDAQVVLQPVKVTATKQKISASQSQVTNRRDPVHNFNIALPFTAPQIDYSSSFEGDADAVHHSTVVINATGGEQGEVIQISSTWGTNQTITLDASGNGTSNVATPSHEGCFDGDIRVSAGTQLLSVIKDNCY